MPTLHPASRHSAVATVTGSTSSGGLNGQSSSESARSTTTPGWRHWEGVWEGGTVVGQMWRACVRARVHFAMTYVVDVGDVVFVNSDGLKRENE